MVSRARPVHVARRGTSRSAVAKIVRDNRFRPYRLRITQFRPSVDDVLLIYAAHIGDPTFALRDADGLDAALAQPWQSAGGEDAYGSLHLKAAVLYAGIDNRQAFVDGNKRVAFFTLRLFYDLAGYEFAPPDTEMYDLAMYVANTRPVDFGYVAQSFEQWTLPTDDVHEYELSD